MPLQTTLKSIARRVLGEVTVPIHQGPLQGQRMCLVAGSRFVRGTYEPEITAAVRKHLRTGDFVLDVGGHIGYFAMMAGMLVGRTGLVYAFEPIERNYKVMLTNLKANDMAQVQHFGVAVSDRAGVAPFNSRTGSGTGHLAAAGQGDTTVRTVALATSRCRGRPR